MPSPIRKVRGKKVYKRKGGSIGGKWAVHSQSLDKKKRARKNSRLRKMYPQAYDWSDISFLTPYLAFSLVVTTIFSFIKSGNAL